MPLICYSFENQVNQKKKKYSNTRSVEQFWVLPVVFRIQQNRRTFNASHFTFLSPIKTVSTIHSSLLTPAESVHGFFWIVLVDPMKWAIKIKTMKEKISKFPWISLDQWVIQTSQVRWINRLNHWTVSMLKCDWIWSNSIRSMKNIRKTSSRYGNLSHVIQTYVKSRQLEYKWPFKCKWWIWFSSLAWLIQNQMIQKKNVRCILCAVERNVYVLFVWNRLIWVELVWHLIVVHGVNKNKIFSKKCAMCSTTDKNTFSL